VVKNYVHSPRIRPCRRCGTDAVKQVSLRKVGGAVLWSVLPVYGCQNPFATPPPSQQSSIVIFAIVRVSLLLVLSEVWAARRLIQDYTSKVKSWTAYLEYTIIEGLDRLDPR
jgi:hypothetical protein